MTTNEILTKLDSLWIQIFRADTVSEAYEILADKIEELEKELDKRWLQAK
jgi:hypothetical protein